MKKPLLAFTLSFFLPGAGLAYLGKWKWGIANLVAVFAIGCLMGLFLPAALFEKVIGPVAAGLGGGSGVLAEYFAKMMNAKSIGNDRT